ncbi:hypothetical protein MNBD_GAMMA17-1640 [hydrothermal vent metagenome]|uniref:Uncharacterized protein n=1 Tax=hydrothermal vent metagenome TaxID=652676 RepID=A0A3B0ZET9_9ZZZZ
MPKPLGEDEIQSDEDSLAASQLCEWIKAKGQLSFASWQFGAEKDWMARAV